MSTQLVQAALGLFSGSIVGFSLGLVGGGGSILAVPLMIYVVGVPTAHIYMVSGRADTQPLFPDDPYIAANRRVTITLMREQPPLPPNLKP